MRAGFCLSSDRDLLVGGAHPDVLIGGAAVSAKQRAKYIMCRRLKDMTDLFQTTQNALKSLVFALLSFFTSLSCKSRKVKARALHFFTPLANTLLNINIACW